MKQLPLFKELKRQAEFGGSLLKGKRKSARPFSKKKAMHVTFRRSNSYGNLSLLRKQRQIQSLVRALAKKHRIRIYEFSVNLNHLHMLLRSLLKKDFQNFLRECSIRMVWLMTGTKKGKGLLTRFWENRPWSRIVEWGRVFAAAKDYILRNRLEACGEIPYNRKIKTSAALKLPRPFY